MKRRTVIAGGLTLAAAGGIGVGLARPKDHGAPHDAYFSQLNELLRREGPGRPVMLLDLDRVNRNIDVLRASVGDAKTYRVVVKSLPSVKLLRHVMQRAKTNALMVFHQPFLNLIATHFPDADVLLGKPMPVAAARTFYNKLGATAFNPARQVQWLIDTRERLLQYRALAKELGVRMRLNIEIDVGLHRGGLEQPEAIEPVLQDIKQNADVLSFAGLMGYEPHLTGLGADLSHPSVRSVLAIYQGFIDRAKLSVPTEQLTLNGAGSHTLRIYENDHTMNDLAAGSGVVMPTDFDTYHLRDNEAALFIATPVLKRYDSLRAPGDPWMLDVMQWWDPNLQRLHFIYGGKWKARFVSPAGIPDSLYTSTNQQPITTSASVNLAVDDYVFLRPTQSEFVMLQFGDLLVTRSNTIIDRWDVFHETG